MVRAVQKTIDYSTKQALEQMIHRCGLSTAYNIFEYSIRGHNGTKFMFQGLEANPESIRGWESIDIIWVDEAQAVSKETWNLLLPTARKHGVEVWITFNPKLSTDYAWKLAKNPEDNWFVQFVTYKDMPSSWRSPQAEQIRLRMLKEDPDLYSHEYLGQLREGAEAKVLPLKNLHLSISQYRKQYEVGVPVAGLDIADSDSGDHNCLNIKRGPVITYINRWRGLDPAKTVERANKICLSKGVTLLSYDAGGFGSVVKSAFNYINPKYVVRPVHFGGKVAGPKRQFQYLISNKDFFARRKDQLGWALRMRLERLSQITSGEIENLAFQF